MLLTVILSVFSTSLLLLFYLSSTQGPRTISPQGCRMSYMSPSYVLQPDFNASWTPLARRYSLWLYREVGWDSNNELNGIPVIFIPGNAGSSHQVRSIASSATRQYYSSPSYVSPAFTSRSMKPLDVFSVEFNEDLSAFHGPTLESQRIYTSHAISYILSLYSPNTSIIVMGHSMGGIVATSLLPSPHISSIITMSTPHSVPPARFDSRIDSIYKNAINQVKHDSTPILSICGGVTDEMIPSEFCAVPVGDNGAFRKTVYTSALEGCWTGVGHREMVWCHQVRWRVARAGLELGLATNNLVNPLVLQDWFRDGLDLPAPAEVPISLDLGRTEYEILPDGLPLTLRWPAGSMTYLLPVPHSKHPGDITKIDMYLSKGIISPISPIDHISLRATIHLCRRPMSVPASEHPLCRPLQPDSLKLIPNPSVDMPFPVPSEGVDESEGVVAFTAALPETPDDTWVAVTTEDGNSESWATAALAPSFALQNDASILSALFNEVSVALDPTALRTEIRLPRFLSNVLLVYRLTPTLAKACHESLLPPLLLHTSNPSEAHYHRLHNDQPVLLHSHSSAPFLHMSTSLRHAYSRGINLTIYSSGECGATQLAVNVDWWNSLGRWGPRYWNALISWCAATVGLLIFTALSSWDSEALMPGVVQSLNIYTKLTLPKLILLSFAVSFVPLPEDLFLGNAGEPFFCLIAPLILLLSSGLVSVTWFFLVILMWPLGKLSGAAARLPRRKEEPSGMRKRALLSILFISALVSFFIPWQVAFLVCYLIHFYHCATNGKPVTMDQYAGHNHKMHILLMMTWCLPIVAPVLVVWVRTLATAGLTTPFDGDHFVINVIGFMTLTYIATILQGPLFLRRQRWELISVGHCYAIGAAVIFAVGARSTYRMYEALNWPTMFLVIFRTGPMLFGRQL